MIRPRTSHVLSIHALTIAAVSAFALGLAACGVKGALEPPPGTAAAVEAEQQAQGPATYPADEAARRQADAAAYGAKVGPAVSQAPNAKRRSSFDWLLD